MDFESEPSSWDFPKFCNCGTTSQDSWLRSVKRKLDEFEGSGRFAGPPRPVARVEFENECAALREMVGTQQQAIQDLYVELEEERSAASTAANETMTMILRLQGEKAEALMEARQFKRFAEEKMEHDGHEIAALEDLLYKREQTVQALSCEVQAYRHRMLSFGLSEAEVDDGDDGRKISVFEYPPLRCSLNEPRGGFEDDYDDEGRYDDDVEKYAFGETPRSRDHLKNLEHRIYQMERSPSNNQLNGDFSGSRNVLDKLVVGQSPRRSRHGRKFSNDSRSFVRENGADHNSGSPKFGESFKNTYISPDEYSSRKTDNVSEVGDDTSDRVYTIDSVHNGVSYSGYAEPKAGIGNGEDVTATPRGPLDQTETADPDIKKLYMRLQALEADRESMRQAIHSMGTDKAQLVLLKEIAQQLCKDKSADRQVALKKPSVSRSWPFLSIFKWVMSLVFWRRKARRTKYMFGSTSKSAGLLVLLDKRPQATPWRCLTSTQV